MLESGDSSISVIPGDNSTIVTLSISNQNTKRDLLELFFDECYRLQVIRVIQPSKTDLAGLTKLVLKSEDHFFRQKHQ